LGVDRALAGWQAWQRSAGPVLVADAGTALSLTWIDRQGCFRGGRLLAGAALQLQSLHAKTQALPLLQAPVSCSPADGWPQQTDAAMAVGVLDGLAGALQRAAAALVQQQPGLQLWLTGGDGAVLHPLLDPSGEQDRPWTLAPGLCLDGVAAAAAIS
jgi:type III pantothenate kinase